MRPCERFVRQPSERAAPQHPFSVFRGSHLDELHGEAWCRLRDMRREALECCPTVTHNPNTSQMFWIEKQLSDITYAHKNASGPQQPLDHYIKKTNTQCKFKCIIQEIQKPHIPPTRRTSYCLKPLIPASIKHNTFKRTLRHVTNTLTVEQPHICIHSFIHCLLLCISLKYLHLLFI